MPLTLASGRCLSRLAHRRGSWLRREVRSRSRGDYMDLREALAANSRAAPLTEVKRAELERLVPGLREGWDHGVFDPSCADIDVGGLTRRAWPHFRRTGGGSLFGAASFRSADWRSDGSVEPGRRRLARPIIVNAAGAWADDVPRRCGALAAGHPAVPPNHHPVAASAARVYASCRLSTMRSSASTSRAKPTIASGSARMTKPPAMPATPRPRRSTSPSRSTASSLSWIGRSRR